MKKINFKNKEEIENKALKKSIKNYRNEKRQELENLKSPLIKNKKKVESKKINQDEFNPKKSPLENNFNTDDSLIRLNKRLSQLGIASRREAEEMILDGKVKVNNFIVKDLSFSVSSKDVILINNKKINNIKPKTKIYLMNKPTGYITSKKDEKGRKTIFDLLPKSLKNLITVGRLDYNTEGLLLLTNNGELARYLELPSSKIERVYHVKVFGYIDQKKIDKLQKTSIIDGIKYTGFKINKLKIGEPYSSFEISIKEGKNREIRNCMKNVNLNVVKLKRMKYYSYVLRKIPYGSFIEGKLDQELIKIINENH